MKELEPLQEAPWALENLPPFPAVAGKLLEILSRDDVTVREVEKFIAAEPVFAAQVLQTANSPLFALRSQVKTISHGIVVLGLDRVKAITLTHGLKDFLTPVLKIETLQYCWQNSLAGALIAEKLAPLGRIDPSLAYTAGLLRDIGRLALLVKYPGPYSNMLAVSQDHGFDLLATERDLFDLDHCQAGAWVMGKMQMPPELCEVTARHHQPPTGRSFDLLALVRAADRLADALGFCVMLLGDQQPAFEDLLQELPEGVATRLGSNPDELRAEIAAQLQILCGFSSPIIPLSPPCRRPAVIEPSGPGVQEPAERLGMLFWKLENRKQTCEPRP